MAEAGVNIASTVMETVASAQNESVVSGIEFQASQVIERLEEAVEKAEDGDGGSAAGQSWKNSSAFLPLPSKTTEEILSQLEDMIIHEDSGSPSDSPEEEGSHRPTVAPLPQLDAAARLAVVTHSVAAFSTALERSHLQRLSTRITSDTTRWLSHLFRFFDCAAFFHDDMLEGVVKLTRMMLHYKYPKYLEDGFDALTSRPPVIYSSVASPLGVVQHICRQLGLPMYCVRPVPCNTLFGSQQKIDVAALERLIEEDKASNRIPLIVLADAGTTIAGHVDNVQRLQELCKQHDIWFHLRGHSLAALAMVSVQNMPTRIADSFTLPLGIWLGIPALPVVTLYRLFDGSSKRQGQTMSAVGVPRESTLPLVAGLTADHFTRRLSCLSLWAALQALGRDGVQSKVREAFESSELIWKKISKYPCLRLLSQQPGGEAGTFTVAELVSKPVGTAVLLEVVACTVVFQFVPESSNSDAGGRVPSYYDKLNSWLGQILQRDASHVPMEICELETSGVVLRYCPLEMDGDKIPDAADVEMFVICLEQQLDILSATVQHKEMFQRLVTASPRLRLVDMPGWAGLGGVRYVPEGWEQLMTDQAKEELNRLNMQLVEQLHSTDAAFSVGEGTDGLVCVRFGMVTTDTDVEELLGLVVTMGQEVEESSRFLETMTEIVKKGIEAATLDLQKENEERLWQEGILRHVPVFGSLVNWWSPPSKESGIKGRSLNLTAGVVESTENIYRYHMQLQQGASSPPGSRNPPQPQVQTPVAPSVGGKHSRSSSHSSEQSQSQSVPTSTVVITSPEVVSESVTS
ncbi:putative pyridoxal-dependent decarboxylase domain-containing protein 2 [Zootermopsis nevadensis]|uniref:Pyridoxal-dependent decarboxylase domain-containing protein 1 n=1 Tax=Zootermopsis nevadensis TaxID=136037 RepID=A0A067RWL3_ZOONE|nr:putative pyridoxal-dependent decarboxylase domain-containing protein 2 [Zootermopsis nevadensis]KDR24299.1 Pyridoxal-dependent decarboxylase domain-containing protein 1 [Zootermopsis nevadensis]